MPDDIPVRESQGWHDLVAEGERLANESGRAREARGKRSERQAVAYFQAWRPLTRRERELLERAMGSAAADLLDSWDSEVTDDA